MLSTPILDSVPSFDATQSYIFNFNIIGGDQVVKNRLIITRVSDSVEVYNQIQETFNLSHTLAMNTLANNVQYQAKLTTFNLAGTESSVSNTVLFTCYTTPSLSFTNLVESQIINNSSYEFDLTYSQSEGEQLQSYEIDLYDANGELLTTNSDQYDNLLKYTFTGFLDNVAYKISAKCVTVHGMNVTTGIINFTVNYITPNIGAAIILENQPITGQIKISTNIKDIIGVSNPNPPNYINNEKVDTTTSGNYVQFDNGFSIDGDFTLKIWGDHFVNRQTFCTLYGVDDIDTSYHRIELQYFDGQIFVYVKVNNSVYFICTEILPVPIDTDNLYICFQRNGYLYDLTVQNLGSS